jgi:hypothetical protein
MQGKHCKKEQIFRAFKKSKDWNVLAIKNSPIDNGETEGRSFVLFNRESIELFFLCYNLYIT